MLSNWRIGICHCMLTEILVNWRDTKKFKLVRSCTILFFARLFDEITEMLEIFNISHLFSSTT